MAEVSLGLTLDLISWEYTITTDTVAPDAEAQHRGERGFPMYFRRIQMEYRRKRSILVFGTTSTFNSRGSSCDTTHLGSGCSGLILGISIMGLRDSTVVFYDVVPGTPRL